MPHHTGKQRLFAGLRLLRQFARHNRQSVARHLGVKGAAAFQFRFQFRQEQLHRLDQRGGFDLFRHHTLPNLNRCIRSNSTSETRRPMAARSTLRSRPET